ncbi:MAG: hypothetical protein EOM20_12990 [Spartobacteria bacterium]|nr:hypothetical protein [Spartobacteria bacterium]
MSLRINLLQDEEIRHAGMLGEAFLLRIVVIVVVCLLGLGIALSMLHANSIRREMDGLQRLYQQKDPIYQEVRAMQADIAENEGIRSEMEGWRTSSPDWGAYLMDVQKLVPDSIQMVRLSLRGEINMPRTKGSTSKAVLPYREYRMTVDGISQGELADEVVIKFVRDLKEAPGLSEFLDAVTLQRIEKEKLGGRDAVDMQRRTFAIQAVSRRLEMTGGRKAKPKADEKKMRRE